MGSKPRSSASSSVSMEDLVKNFEEQASRMDTLQEQLNEIQNQVTSQFTQYQTAMEQLRAILDNQEKIKEFIVVQEVSESMGSRTSRHYTSSLLVHESSPTTS